MSYRTGQSLTGTIVTDIDATPKVTPGQTFTITVENIWVWAVPGPAGYTCDGQGHQLAAIQVVEG